MTKTLDELVADCVANPGNPTGVTRDRDASDAAREAAYDACVKRQEEAWKSAPAEDAEPERRDDRTRDDSRSEDAYQRYENWLVNAWRGAR